MSGACVIFFISRSTTCLGKYNWLKRCRVEELVCLVRVLLCYLFYQQIYYLSGEVQLVKTM